MHAQSTYRVRKVRSGETLRNYRFTYEVSDEDDSSVVASCHICGKASLRALSIIDANGRTWQVTPNRRVMPSRWIVSDDTAHEVVHLDARLAGKLIAPLYSTALVVRDSHGDEICRMIDPRTSVPDRVFGTGPDEWAVIRGDELVARVVTLSTTNERPGGILQRLAHTFAGSDRGFVSRGAKHVLPAPVVLAMLALHDEITDVS